MKPSQEREDLYRLAGLLADLDRVLNPLSGRFLGHFFVEPGPPPPLPPTGVPGTDAVKAPAASAFEWQRAPEPAYIPAARTPSRPPLQREPSQAQTFRNERPDANLDPEITEADRTSPDPKPIQNAFEAYPPPERGKPRSPVSRPPPDTAAGPHEPEHVPIGGNSTTRIPPPSPYAASPPTEDPMPQAFRAFLSRETPADPYPATVRASGTSQRRETGSQTDHPRAAEAERHKAHGPRPRPGASAHENHDIAEPVATRPPPPDAPHAIPPPAGRTLQPSPPLKTSGEDATKAETFTDATAPADPKTVDLVWPEKQAATESKATRTAPIVRPPAPDHIQERHSPNIQARKHLSAIVPELRGGDAEPDRTASPHTYPPPPGKPSVPTGESVVSAGPQWQAQDNQPHGIDWQVDRRWAEQLLGPVNQSAPDPPETTQSEPEDDFDDLIEPDTSASAYRSKGFKRRGRHIGRANASQLQRLEQALERRHLDRSLRRP